MRLRTLGIACAILLVHLGCRAQSPIDLSVPDQVSRRFMEKDVWKRFTICARVNPFYLRADFDGDGKPDFVVLIETNDTHEEYFAFVLSSRSGVELSARKGRPFDGWTIPPRGAWKERKNTSRPNRDAYVIKFGGPGILEYWDGTKWVSQAWGD